MLSPKPIIVSGKDFHCLLNADQGGWSHIYIKRILVSVPRLPPPNAALDALAAFSAVAALAEPTAPTAATTFVELAALVATATPTTVAALVSIVA